MWRRRTKKVEHARAIARRYNNLVYVVKEIIFRFPFSKEGGDDDVVIRHGSICGT